MTITVFKDVVAAYMNRLAASFVTAAGNDLLLLAMNDARRAAQRDHEFEQLRTEDAFLTTSVAGANWQTGCKTAPGGATAVLMRRVDEVWNFSTQTLGVVTYYPRTTRIDFTYSGQFKRELPVTSDRFVLANPQNYITQNRFAYCVGSTLYVTTQAAETAPFKLVGIRWLDDLTGSEDPDIFLTYYADWFKHATIASLNVYLKDSERFPIDVEFLSRAWTSVKQHDGTIANMGESVNLE